ncbi:hypothetical protein ONA91_24995 [Micromonospora sp. DR5-3]|uniref:hypothetical protein n=1 Tax=unclassified Micromonospora TaxID=2617518 RepID=UPI0011DBEE25|nr:MULTISPECIES: hypothetical protein [unclassified Micromonospora]MCW3817715.1 hypothetical protein [Micromonospora sp. DR5-3]TYC20024.1 hypothetical protein FXF52_33455 [Micromonospora sp. MP36]
MFAPLVAISLLVCGLVLNAATISYDLTHWGAVYYAPPEVAANRNGLADLALTLFDQLALVVSGLAVVGLLLSTVGLVRGRKWAHVTASMLIAPFALCCGLQFINGRNSFTGNLDDPNNIAPRHTFAPAWVLICDRLGPPLLVGAAIVVLFLMFIPPVHRRFYPPPQHCDPDG